MQQLPDGAVFAKAHAEDRIVLTFDLDFGEIIALSGGQAVSVILFRLRDTRTDTVIHRLLDVLPTRNSRSWTVRSWSSKMVAIV